jgi:hypothetical protein
MRAVLPSSTSATTSRSLYFPAPKPSRQGSASFPPATGGHRDGQRTPKLTTVFIPGAPRPAPRRYRHREGCPARRESARWNRSAVGPPADNTEIGLGTCAPWNRKERRCRPSLGKKWGRRNRREQGRARCRARPRVCRHSRGLAPGSPPPGTDAGRTHPPPASTGGSPGVGNGPRERQWRGQPRAADR